MRRKLFLNKWVKLNHLMVKHLKIAVGDREFETSGTKTKNNIDNFIITWQWRRTKNCSFRSSCCLNTFAGHNRRQSGFNCFNTRLKNYKKFALRVKLQEHFQKLETRILSRKSEYSNTGTHFIKHSIGPDHQ